MAYPGQVPGNGVGSQKKGRSKAVSNVELHLELRVAVLITMKVVEDKKVKRLIKNGQVEYQTLNDPEKLWERKEARSTLIQKIFSGELAMPYIPQLWA